MRLGKINRASSQQTDGQAYDAGSKATESRALVALAPAAAPHETAGNYRQAPFLAQLIATKGLHPQTRGRRRAAPGEAIAAYRVAAALVGK